MPTDLLLDNPIWHALSTQQRRFAEGNDLAKRFLPGIGPLGAIPGQSATAYEALAEVVRPDGVVALFLEAEPAPPSGWIQVHNDVLYQMIGDGPLTLAAMVGGRELTTADVPQMIELADLTEPGPFREQTSELGRFVGLFREGRLAAMSGERLAVPGFTEVSAVCTHPEQRGHGYARSLMSEILRGILGRGETPFLHVRASNVSAIALYESLGFRIRRSLQLAVIKNETRR